MSSNSSIHVKARSIDDFMKPHHLISEEARRFCAALRRFVDEEVLPHEHELDDYWDWTERKEETFVHNLWKRLLIDLGLQKSFVPPELGGTGGFSNVDMVAMIEEVARGDYGLATTAFISPWSIAALAIPTPNESLLKEVASHLLSDEVYLICSALTEPHAGGSLEDLRLKGAFIRTKARLEGNEWVVNGHKLWPSAFREAKMYRVLCAIEGAQFPNNLAQIFVPAHAKGVSTSRPYRKMGASIDTNGDIWFENVRVPKEMKAHEDPEEELKSIKANVAIGRLFTSAFVLGVMKRAYEVLRKYVENRETAGRPMGDHEAIAYDLGKIAQDIMTAESYLYDAAARMDRPELYGPPWERKMLVVASACQNTVGELGWKVVTRGLEIMGSFGYSREGRMEKLARDIKIGHIVVGGPTLRLMEVARYYFGSE
jgi:alkylation response protein AidB-like acyl-CoA dehydrogenase